MGTLFVVGLGPGDAGHITQEGWSYLSSDKPLYLRTAIHPTVDFLQAQGLTFTSFDYLYEEKADFEEIYQTIAHKLIALSEREDIVFAVPGSPLVAERTVRILWEAAQEQRLTLKLLPGMSFLEILYPRLGIDPIEGVYIADTKDVENLPFDFQGTLILTQLYSQAVASEVKLSLMERYEDEQAVTVVHHLSLGDEKIETIPLYELDRLAYVDHLTSLVIPKKLVKEATPFTLEPLKEVVKALRGENGCPWDKLQTHSTLRRYLLEEVYEVLEAIDREDVDNLKEELGDVLLQIVFHARLAEEQGFFTLQDIIDDITEKMIRRHPHVFGDMNVADAAEVNLRWEALKQKEKGHKNKKILENIPKGLPALLYGQKLQEKAAKVGFDWDSPEGAWEKLAEEMEEFKEALAEKDAKNAEEEGGDVLFSLLNVFRWYKISGENALTHANSKFRRRFDHVEARVTETGRPWEDFSLVELDNYWDEAKLAERAAQENATR